MAIGQWWKMTWRMAFDGRWHGSLEEDGVGNWPLVEDGWATAWPLMADVMAHRREMAWQLAIGGRWQGSLVEDRVARRREMVWALVENGIAQCSLVVDDVAHW